MFAIRPAFHMSKAKRMPADAGPKTEHQVTLRRVVTWMSALSLAVCLLVFTATARGQAPGGAPVGQPVPMGQPNGAVPTGPMSNAPSTIAIPDTPSPNLAAQPTTTNSATSAAQSFLSRIPGGAIPTRNLLQVLQDGGPLMIPIAVCSIILFVFVFERSISLRKGRVIPGPFVKRFLEQVREKQLDREQALELCEQNGSPVAEVFAAAVKKWGRPSVEVEQAIIDAGERVTNGLRRYLRLFNGITTITPLMGLLGTVLGMIRAFNAIVAAGAMGRPELLAAGISQALLTTAAGLTVAIPALIAYLYFVSRVDRLIMEIDSLGQELVGLISSDAWQNEQEPKSRSRGKAA